jgi:chaperonin cofactor prefoldin
LVNSENERLDNLIQYVSELEKRIKFLEDKDRKFNERIIENLKNHNLIMEYDNGQFSILG